MANNKTKNTLIVFLKYPEAGKVKTRLAKDLGDQRAAEIYSEMSLEIINNVLDTSSYNTIIFYDPPEKEKENEIRNWIGKKEVQYLPQVGNTLGDKISNAFKEVFSSKSKRAVIIGTDCTDVTSETITQAIKSLTDVDVVLGPAVDGGYYLLGLNNHTPEIFKGIKWSTESVLNQTIEKIKENKLSYELLNTLQDIDTLDDLNTRFESFYKTAESNS
ncbi:MAG: hypothetical protein DHS20C13_21470 [Thermodesulfobacteriota bacterium]|nr:MAG: hypothetical protein DHS20C13_21470 [Thermodesulfobacteriota bacterium]